MPSSSDPDPALDHVQQGWRHLQRQRPLAAWASWQSALRLVPDHPAAREALERLGSAEELPAVAKSVPRFQAPDDDARRARWDVQLKGRDHGDLNAAADSFAVLVHDDPADAPAWTNLGLCFAWLGRNVEAIRALDRAVPLQAAASFDRAVNAWSIAEVLRQGEGAEDLADDLVHAWVVEWQDDDAMPRLTDWPELCPVPLPINPERDQPPLADVEVFEWLDRPMPDSVSTSRSAADLPRVVATLLSTPRSLRLSTPEPRNLATIAAQLERAVDQSRCTIRRESTPLTFSLLDAAVWTVRFPAGLDSEVARSLARDAVEHACENLWIHVPRHGLDDRSPLEASRSARGGDLVARAKLAAVVSVREQLGARPRTAALYQNYPFDRLRRRLGLDLDDPNAVDPDDCTCMSEVELDQLDPANLDDNRLADASISAAGLQDDRLTARFTAALLRTRAPSVARVASPDLFAALVREALNAHDPGLALDWIEQAKPTNGGRDRRTYDTWSAEIHARNANPDAAVRTYQTLLEEADLRGACALDAAETLLDNGYDQHAEPFLSLARDHARRSSDLTTMRRAEALLNSLAPEKAWGGGTWGLT